MDERIGFITDQGKQILTVDLSNCSARRVEEILRGLPQIVTMHPLCSLLILADFTGASFDADAIRAMKEAAVFDKPFVKRTAWVGAENFPQEFYESLTTFSRRQFPTFKTREEALTWLVKD